MRKRQVGYQLEQLRRDKGLKLEDVTSRTGLSESKVNRIERGRLGIKPEDLDRLLDLYEVEDAGLRGVLHSIARHSSKRGWWQNYRDMIDPAYADLISLEDGAKSMRTYESMLIPGLLQTASYAHATIEAIRMDPQPEEVNRLVEVRKARQSVLTKPDEPLELWAVIHEAALRPRMRNSPHLMREQLQHLLDASRLPHVSIQVLPIDAPPHAGMSGSFTTLGFPETADLDVVLVESLTSALYVEDTAEVGRYNSAFERLRAAALPFDSSACLIEELKDSIK
ncbi:helix-turn-helix transcriptional regulator [Streptomyces sp. NPDC006355]|uniref:helix-turn-helix domain-containing protein n=1 Tax=Streptomyces sp. NPDC006355 TaxID=3156758 RepID=UPI0033B935D8